SAPHTGLAALAAEARRDFGRLRYPAPNWIPCVPGPDGKPALGNIHCFNWGVTLSHGAMAGDIPGLAEGVNRPARALSGSLFVAGAANVLPALALHDDRELEPTRNFVQR